MAAELREAGRRAAAGPAVAGAPPEERVRAGPRRSRAGRRRRSPPSGRPPSRPATGTPACRPSGRGCRRGARRAAPPDADRPAQDVDPGDRDQPRGDEGRGARGPRALEGAPSRGRRAPRARRRPRRRDARPLIALVPRPGQPDPRPGGGPPGPGGARPRLRPVGRLRVAGPGRPARAGAAQEARTAPVREGAARRGVRGRSRARPIELVESARRGRRSSGPLADGRFDARDDGASLSTVEALLDVRDPAATTSPGPSTSAGAGVASIGQMFARAGGALDADVRRGRGRARRRRRAARLRSTPRSDSRSPRRTITCARTRSRDDRLRLAVGRGRSGRRCRCPRRAHGRRRDAPDRRGWLDVWDEIARPRLDHPGRSDRDGAHVEPGDPTDPDQNRRSAMAPSSAGGSLRRPRAPGRGDAEQPGSSAPSSTCLSRRAGSRPGATVRRRSPSSTCRVTPR